jgi:hypothetical protein
MRLLITIGNSNFQLQPATLLDASCRATYFRKEPAGLQQAFSICKYSQTAEMGNQD